MASKHTGKTYNQDKTCGNALKYVKSRNPKFLGNIEPSNSRKGRDHYYSDDLADCCEKDFEV